MQSFYKILSEKTVCALSLVLVFISVFSTAQADAEEIEIKARLRLDQSAVAKQIDQIISENNRFSSVMTGLKYEDELPVYIDEVHFDLQIGSSQSVYQSGDQSLLTKIPQIQISGSIPRVRISGLITKVINGAQFNIKVDSECSNINYAVTFSQNEIHTQFLNQSTESKMAFGSVVSNIGSFNCTAIQGMDSFLVQRVSSVLQNKAMLEQLISAQLDGLLKQKAQQLNQTSTAAVNDLLKKIDTELYVSQSQLGFNKDQSILDLTLKTTRVIQYAPKNTSFKSTASGKSSASFSVAKTDFDFLIQNAMTKKINKLQYSSDDIPEFKKLLNSRFKQFFVWPALMSRPKGQALVLKPTLESFSTHIPTNQFQKSFDFKLQVGQWVFDSSQAMVYLRSNASFAADAANSIRLQNLTNSYVWDAAYLSNHNVSQRISLGLVNSAAQSMIQEKINNMIPTSSPSFLKQIKYLHLSEDQILELGLEQSR